MVKVLAAVICIMALMVGCGCRSDEPTKPTIELSNIEQAEYYLKLAEDPWNKATGEYYLDMARTYLLKEAVEKGLVLDKDGKPLVED